MKTRYLVGILLLSVLVVLSIFAAGFATHWILSDRGMLVHIPRPGSALLAGNVPDERERFSLFWEAWEIVKRDFYGDVPDEGNELPYAAIRGVLGVLEDPYTILVEPTPRELEKDTLRGSFGGIGAWVLQREDGAVVLSPMPGRPAARAGVLEGDIVVAVDGQDVTGAFQSEVVALIRGPVGTVVRITVRRESTGEELEFHIRREKIETPTVEWRVMDEAPDVGYIRISLVGERTKDELAEAISELKDAGASRLILDLRGNPGGLLDGSVRVASQFLDGGPVVRERRKDGQERVYTATAGGPALEMPLAVLVDGGTASGAEIIAGALQARGRAPLVGERTFGKGAVQNVYDLSDGSSLHVTVAKLFTPEGHLIDGEGLEPDETVSYPEEARAGGEEADPQLKRALEILAPTSEPVGG